MWWFLHKLFGWDYIAWRNSADRGIARVREDGEGGAWYWRYKAAQVWDRITDEKDVVWLTCLPSKYMATLPPAEEPSKVVKPKENRLTIKFTDGTVSYWSVDEWDVEDMQSPWASFINWIGEPAAGEEDVFWFQYRTGLTMIRRGNVAHVYIQVSGVE